MALIPCRRCHAPMAANPPRPGRTRACPRCGEPFAEQGDIRPSDRLRNQTCVVCHRILTLRQAVAGKLCGDRKCRNHHLGKIVSARRRAKVAERRRRREQLEPQVARRLGLEPAGAFAVALLPSNDRPIANLPERRRRAFRDLLTRLISETAAARASSESSFETEGGPPQAAAEDQTAGEAAVSSRACATCRGHCCRLGVNSAFQSVRELHRYMTAHAQERPRHVLAAYLSHLPVRSYRDSCVYHTELGCALPREMRAAICNAYYCEELAQFREGQRSAGPRPAFAVAMRDDEIVRSAFIGQPERTCERTRADRAQSIDPEARLHSSGEADIIPAGRTHEPAR